MASSSDPAANKFLSTNIPDYTDFPPQAAAPGLRKLDQVFRCSICGDVFDAPVTVGCGHCFCSGCLRSAISVKQECPACRKTANESHIRPNFSMEEAIMAWNEARPFILDLIEKAQRVPTPPPVNASTNDARSSSPSPRKRKRPRASSSSSVELVQSSSLSNPRDIPTNPSLKDLVPCPICNADVVYEDLNAHIDASCKILTNKRPNVASSHSNVKGKDREGVKDNTAGAWSKIMQKPKSKGAKGKTKKESDPDDEYPIPKVSYATLKDKQLKDILLDYGLPTTGDRALLEARHGRWLQLYNGNLDRSLPNRKSTAVLRGELKKWEEQQVILKKKGKPVVDSPIEHVKQHKSEFDRLIQMARSSNPVSALREASSDASSPAHVNGSATEPSASSDRSSPHPDTAQSPPDSKNGGERMEDVVEGPETASRGGVSPIVVDG